MRGGLKLFIFWKGVFWNTLIQIQIQILFILESSPNMNTNTIVFLKNFSTLSTPETRERAGDWTEVKNVTVFASRSLCQENLVNLVSLKFTFLHSSWNFLHAGGTVTKFFFPPWMIFDEWKKIHRKELFQGWWAGWVTSLIAERAMRPSRGCNRLITCHRTVTRGMFFNLYWKDLFTCHRTVMKMSIFIEMIVSLHVIGLWQGGVEVSLFKLHIMGG